MSPLKRARATTSRRSGRVDRHPPAESVRSRGFSALLNNPMFLLGAIFVGALLVVWGLIQLRSVKGSASGPGLTAVFLAMALFLSAFTRLRATALSVESMQLLTSRGMPIALSGLGVALCAFAASQVTLPESPAGNRGAAAAWILGLVCFMAGILWLSRWRPGLREILGAIKENALELGLLGAIMAAAFILRTWLLDQHPYPWLFDEAMIGIQARLLLTGANTSFFSAGWSGIPTLAYSLDALSLAIFGNTILALRVVSAILGTLAVLFLYLLTRELFDSGVALMAAGFLAAFPLQVQFSRLGVNSGYDVFVAVLTMWLVVRATRRSGLAAYAAAGMAIGLGLYASVGSRLIPILVMVWFALVSIRERAYLRQTMAKLLVCLLAACTAVAPLAVYFVRHPGSFNSRIAQVGIIQTGWLAHELTVPGKTLAAVLWDQFSKSSLVFISQNATGLQFATDRPYLTLAASFFFVIGMGYAFLRALEPRFGILLAWFWGVVIIGGTLTVVPPSNTRLVLASAPVAMLVAVGINQILEVLAYARIPPRWTYAAGAAAVILLSVQNTVLYFDHFRKAATFDDYVAEAVMEIGRGARDLGPDYSLYVIGNPRVSARFPTIEFLATSRVRTDVDPNQAATLDLAGHVPAFIAATPDNLSSLQVLAGRYPGGLLQQIPRKNKPEPLYYSYVLPAPNAP